MYSDLRLYQLDPNFTGYSPGTPGADAARMMRKLHGRVVGEHCPAVLTLRIRLIAASKQPAVD